MTIKIERDAILCVINKNRTSKTDDSFSGNLPSSLQSAKLASPYHKSLQPPRHETNLFFSYQTAPELDETDDDSTVTSSSCSSSTVGVKGVSFAEPIVTQTWWRPRTLRKSVKSFYYTVEETQRFRQEYREERRLKAQEEAESISSSQLSTSNFGGGESGDTPQWDGLQNKNSTSDSDSNCNTTRSLNSDNSSVIQKSHRISRVVVFHKNTRETFIEGEMNDISLGTNSSPCTDSTDRCSHSNSSTTTRICPDKCKTTIDHFFDNDSFWSGQITWY